MPLYEFTCPKCQTTFDELMPASRRDDPAKCPSCGDEHAERILSTFAASGSSRSSGSPAPSRPASSGGGCGCGRPHGSSCRSKG